MKILHLSDIELGLEFESIIDIPENLIDTVNNESTPKRGFFQKLKNQ
mgnify:CR=1 FL=1